MRREYQANPRNKGNTRNSLMEVPDSNRSHTETCRGEPYAPRFRKLLTRPSPSHFSLPPPSARAGGPPVTAVPLPRLAPFGPEPDVIGRAGLGMGPIGAPPDGSRGTPPPS